MVTREPNLGLVNLSALIFVALAVAWAAYLIPKALKHHEDAVRSRSVDRFSHTMRVLARREPVNRRDARLVVTPGRAHSGPVVTTKASAVPASTQREATQRATRRRRRVLGLILVAGLAVVGLAGFDVIGWPWTAVPAAVLVAWLVACRLMVKHERRVWAPVEARVPAEGEPEEAAAEDAFAEAHTTSTPAITDPTLWDPMPVTLPTYVSKPAAAKRTVRTIDLDSTGVWTSGRSEADSALAREAEEAERVTRAQRPGDDSRAVGS